MATERVRTRTIWSALVFLVVVVLAFAALRVAVDAPNLASGEIPDDAFEGRYALHPVIAHAHIAPGVIYLVAAPFQLNRRFRERHFGLHRRMGRVPLSIAFLAIKAGDATRHRRWMIQAAGTTT